MYLIINNNLILGQAIEGVRRVGANNFTLRTVSGFEIPNLTKSQIQPILDFLNIDL